MKKTGLVFSGQGAQYAGMGKEHFHNSAVIRETFEEASQAIGVDMEKLCFEEDLKVLSQTQNTQPALVLLGTAYFRELLENTGIVPEFLAGHSIGELTALTCAGAIQFSDAIKLARSRGCFMQNAVPAGEGAMAAVTGLDQYTVEELCLNHSGSEQEVFISNYNSSEQIVVSGMKKKV